MAEIETYKVSGPSGYALTRTSKPGNTEVDGYVETPHGNVRSFSTDYINTFDGKRYRWTTLRMVIAGRGYFTRIAKFYTKRGLVTVAQRFADQAVKEHS
ncbi:hypothetical protein [Hydrogenophaga laconesensis]|uniref:Uncharacterized protein n=1 Tax=Hydrogenophaga laconesensis TaxID=1805971 RepID=A0ABU1V9I3_9BURK|nr:hypothetical protein [Hydrogenophaga laconesensis]MDR7094126.1 hypothetical protein [Hydrogenophaga laconesensis]